MHLIVIDTQGAVGEFLSNVARMHNIDFDEVAVFYGAVEAAGVDNVVGEHRVDLQNYYKIEPVDNDYLDIEDREIFYYAFEHLVENLRNVFRRLNLYEKNGTLPYTFHSFLNSNDIVLHRQPRLLLSYQHTR